MSLPRPLAPVTVFLTAALALALPHSAGAQRQTGIESGYFSVGIQGYDLDALNGALGQAGLPEIDRSAFRTSVGAVRRLPGRLRTTTSVWWDRFETGGEIVITAGTGPTLVSSTRLGAIGLTSGLDADLLYPSAWNLYVGLGVDLGGGRLVTRRLLGRGGNPGSTTFDADVRENKFTVASIGLTPRLTLESIEFGTKSGVGMRVFLRGGYRFGIASEIEREGFLSQEIAPEFGNSGVALQLGFATRLLDKE